MRNSLILMGAALLLAACNTADNYGQVIAASTPPDAALRAEIVKGAEQLIYDPASIRKAEISNVATFRDGVQGVCVRADSKNVSGVYVGVRSIGIPLRDGRIAGGTLDHPICNRKDVPWQPFPELERLPAK
ncbi:hypothetical protein [Paracoccus laeviglucosivorans]|uniref:Lipoprotein n=1 Tax=Paracoccus laeviglucosivorans TaxID=1197861 RepID=A0A521BVV3_9RHOB|nr:hypothetical protein [Paracoccus laeviglucosivorans]SMO51324.1 hypothetical protein SAMN06265221_103168 [Paracoccus laeviglucosivorans]